MLQLKNDQTQQNQINELHSNVQRQIFLSELVRKTHVNPESLPRNKKDKISLHFDTLLSNLNSILLGQYLQKENMSINISDLILIQKSDRHLGAIIQKLLQENQHNVKY